MTELDGWAMLEASLATFGIVAFCYAFAYRRVKRGEMFVFASWWDLLASSLWVVLLPFAITVFYSDDYSTSQSARNVCVLLSVGSGGSLVWLIGGAFRNSGLVNIILAIVARVAVALLALFTVAKLLEAFDSKKKSDEGGMLSLVAPLAIVGFIFMVLIKPMVGQQEV